MQQWPRSPSLTNSTTSDISLLAPVQYTPWENTSAGEMMKDNQSVIWPFTLPVEATPPPKMSFLNQMKQLAPKLAIRSKRVFYGYLMVFWETLRAWSWLIAFLYLGTEPVLKWKSERNLVFQTSLSHEGKKKHFVRPEL